MKLLSTLFILIASLDLFLGASSANFTCTVPGVTCSAIADWYASNQQAAINGAFWLDQDAGWHAFANGNTTDYCSLYGITCQNSTSYVTKIDFSYSYMAGAIPASIGSLVNLTVVDVEYTLMSGPIPSSIANLVKLTNLDVHSTLMSGDIPTTQLFSLPKLTYLDLSSTYLSGSLPALYTAPGFNSSASNFTYLSVDKTDIVPKRVVVYKPVFNFTCTVPGVTCSALADLFISNYQEAINGSFWLDQDEGWYAFGRGKTVNYCLIYGITCQNGTSYVTQMYFNNSLMAGTIPASFGNLVNLTILDVHSTLMSGPIPSSFGSLNQLTKLDVHSTFMSGSIPTTQLFSLPKLTFLDMSFTFLNGSLPAMYTNATFNSVASNFTFLSVLSTGIPPNRVLVYKSPINFKCTVPGATCSALADFYISDMLTVPQMSYIDCWLAQDYGWKLFGQGQMTSYCSLRGISCDSNTTSVAQIMFQSSAMAGSIPSSIANLVNLTKLDVHSTLMSGDIPTTELFSLPKLTYLDLSYTYLSGSLPATYTSPSFDPKKSTFTYLNVASTLIAPNKTVVQKSSAVKAGHFASFVFALTCTFVLLADYLV